MKNPKPVIIAATATGGIATFFVVQYLGWDRRFTADVNLTAVIFSVLVGGLVFLIASRVVKGRKG